MTIDSETQLDRIEAMLGRILNDLDLIFHRLDVVEEKTGIHLNIKPNLEIDHAFIRELGRLTQLKVRSEFADVENYGHASTSSR